jgi:hypothetical protein
MRFRTARLAQIGLLWCVIASGFCALVLICDSARAEDPFLSVPAPAPPKPKPRPRPAPEPGAPAIVPAPAPAAVTVAPPGSRARIVPRDAETRVGWAANWRQRTPGVCTVWFIPTLELVNPPKHGTVRFVTADVSPQSRSGCDNSVTGVAVMYRPNPGFVGEDQFTYNRPVDPMTDNKLGRGGLITVILAVH